MLAGLQRLLAWKLDLTHVDPRGLTVLTSAGGANTRYPAGRRVVAHTILGHRSTSDTTCPGGPVIGRLPAIGAAVARTGGPKIYGGAATVAAVSPERGGYAGVHARFSSTVRWNGRNAAGQLAPAGWATVTVTAPPAAPARGR